jgi:hypothetical protein
LPFCILDAAHYQVGLSFCHVSLNERNDLFGGAAGQNERVEVGGSEAHPALRSS